MRVLPLGPARVTLIPVLRGPVSEAERVRILLEGASFDVLGLSVSPEELEALFNDPDARVEPASLQEEVYVRELSRFGEVSLPPPCFVEALRVARERNLSCVALDLDEEAFTELYVQSVSGWEVVRHFSKLKRLARTKVEAEDPEELLLRLDALLTRFKGHRRVEEAREVQMATAIRRLAGEHRRPGLLVDRERLDGVLHRLSTGPPSGDTAGA